MQQIDEFYKANPGTRPSKRVVAATYITLSRIANRKRSDAFEASNEEIGELSGLSHDSIARATNLLMRIADIEKKESPGRSSNFYELNDSIPSMLNRQPERMLNRQPERMLPEDDDPTTQNVVHAGSVYNRQPERMLEPSPHYVEEKKNIKKEVTPPTPSLNPTTLKNGVIPFQEILNHLNSTAEKSFSLNVDQKKLIVKRWMEGKRLKQFFYVAENKTRQWKGTDQERYLRPETLFGEKMDSYCNEPVYFKKQKADGSPVEQNPEQKQKDQDFKSMTPENFVKKYPNEAWLLKARHRK